MDLKMVWGLDYIYLTRDRDKWRTLLNIVMYLRVTENEGNFLDIFGTFSVSRRILLCAAS
jgi:hypothetical protein